MFTICSKKWDAAKHWDQPEKKSQSIRVLAIRKLVEEHVRKRDFNRIH
jgi:hypothetical protein